MRISPPPKKKHSDQGFSALIRWTAYLKNITMFRQNKAT